MKKHDDKLNVIESVKVWYGFSIFTIILALVAYPLLMTFAFALFMILISGDRDIIFKNDFLGAIALAMQLMLIAVIYLRGIKKENPGGKFLRTVKGGFDTFAKSTASTTLGSVISVILMTGILAVLEYIGIIITFSGLKRYLLYVSCALLIVGLTGFMRCVSSYTLSMVYLGILVGSAAIIPYVVNKLFYEKFIFYGVIIGAAAIVMIIMSTILTIRFVKERIWDR